MDNPALRLMATDGPSLFCENYPLPFILDEIQYTPQPTCITLKCYFITIMLVLSSV